MAYLRKYKSLADALKHAKANGETEESAKVDICNAIADGDIHLQVWSGKNCYEGGNVAVPKRLDPADFDWSLSRPFQAWVIGPMVGQHYFWNPEQLPISLVELFTADVERLFPTPLAAKADDPAAKRGSKRSRIKEYLARHYPNGVPEPGHVPRQTLKSCLIEWDKSLKPLDDDTLKRAIDEHNASVKKG